MSLLWLFFSPALLPLFIIGIALALIVGAVTRQRAFSILGGLLLLVMLLPFIDAVLDLLPLGLLLLIVVFSMVWMLRVLSGAILGGRAGDHMVGILAADVVRLLVRALVALLFLPFRLVAGGLRLALSRQW